VLKSSKNILDLVKQTLYNVPTFRITIRFSVLYGCVGERFAVFGHTPAVASRLVALDWRVISVATAFWDKHVLGARLARREGGLSLLEAFGHRDVFG